MVGFLLPQTQPLKLIMSTKYWDLYVYYVKKCERENYINDIDPHHYKMEWNHFWPKCVFGDWPVGQWLTLRQHAIATALQTLAFKKSCLYGGHKNYLSPVLLDLVWPYYRNARSEKMKETMNAEKDENGKSLLGIRNSERLHANKDENGKSLHGLRCAAICHAKKDENGKSLHGLKLSVMTHAKKNENGKSIVGTETSHQVWESTVDGFRGNAGNVAQYNRARGWPSDARVRVS